ncbi:tryptophan 2,3-dioxygenase-like [Littorina saxatilis]|uniref:tryptophan 2,3-dioxygenase-like n=1 Tax=Littorina saxatilis TaxID=31220 RepID=UPI0038B6963B
MATVITYDNYLKVPVLLDCQHPKSDAREEILFILTHQAFELWFKQILRDIDLVRGTLQKPNPEKHIRLMVRSLERIVMIFKVRWKLVFTGTAE